VGYFGRFLFDGTTWTEVEYDTEPAIPEPWLMLDIHDSDIATVWYRPVGPGTGTAYLGITPRIYFESETASTPTDIDREAAGLAHGRDQLQLAPADDAHYRITATELRTYLAEDIALDDGDLDEDDGLGPDVAEVFVEAKAHRFLAALSLPTPEDLPNPT